MCLNLIHAQALESDRLGLEFQLCSYTCCIHGKVAQNAPSLSFFTWEKNMPLGTVLGLSDILHVDFEAWFLTSSTKVNMAANVVMTKQKNEITTF